MPCDIAGGLLEEAAPTDFRAEEIRLPIMYRRDGAVALSLHAADGISPEGGFAISRNILELEVGLDAFHQLLLNEAGHSGIVNRVERKYKRVLSSIIHQDGDDP